MLPFVQQLLEGPFLASIFQCTMDFEGPSQFPISWYLSSRYIILQTVSNNQFRMPMHGASARSKMKTISTLPYAFENPHQSCDKCYTRHNPKVKLYGPTETIAKRAAIPLRYCLSTRGTSHEIWSPRRYAHACMHSGSSSKMSQQWQSHLLQNNVIVHPRIILTGNL